jgi:chromosome partitioning protein
MKSICIVNMKGGVGKTTTAVHTAAGLARRGVRVLLVDADPQGNVAHTFGIKPAATLRELLLNESSPEDVIIRDARENLDIIASTTAAFSLERQLAGETQRETLLARRLSRLKEYDVVVTDTSPSMSLLTFNALLFSTYVIIPIGMDLMSVIGARQTLKGVGEVQDLWPDRGLDVLAVVPTCVNPATVATRATFAAIENDPQLNSRLFTPGIRQCIDLTYASACHRTIWEYAPKARAAEDFDALIDFIQSRISLQQAVAI